MNGRWQSATWGSESLAKARLRPLEGQALPEAKEPELQAAGAA
jgi:hypothetical protein